MKRSKSVDLTLDHRQLDDALTTRRYFAKFEKIIGHLDKVADITTAEGLISADEADIVKTYLQALSGSFTTLFYKHLMAGRVAGVAPGALNIDRRDSGFPIYQELVQMANDALQAKGHLASLPKPEKIRQDMVRHILNEHATPGRLQYAMSQRLYYKQLSQRALFWPRNDPQNHWQGNISGERRKYMIHWATYDAQINIPVIYLLQLEDSGRTALPRDGERWPRVQSHLMAQAIASLKLVTIARGFDEDFDDLHPKFVRRIHVGPMYSHAFTEQSGPLRDILAEASGKPGADWALSWTVETLESERVESQRSGFFGSVEREIFKLDHFGKTEAEAGASSLRRALILPQRPYQVLTEHDPPGLRNVRKYVVGAGDRIVSYG